MPIRHLFWDFDGTLYDSYPKLTQAFIQTQSALGLKGAIPPDKALFLLKKTIFHAIRTLTEPAGLDAQQAMKVFRRFHAQVGPFAPYPGLESSLRTLSAAGVKHYLYTHRDMRAVEQLKEDGLWPLFTDAVTKDDGFAEKPAPDALLSLMMRNHVAVAEAAMVGDRDIDIKAGHNAGMRGILFDPDGFYPELEAELRVNSMNALCTAVLASA